MGGSPAAQHSLANSAVQWIPQVGEQVLYFPKGHHAYLKQYPGGDLGISQPWRQQPRIVPPPNTNKCVECVVTNVEFCFPPIGTDPHTTPAVYAKIKLAPRLYSEDAGFNVSATTLNKGEADELKVDVQTAFSLAYRPSDVADFVVPLSKVYSSLVRMLLAHPKKLAMAEATEAVDDGRRRSRAASNAAKSPPRVWKLGDSVRVLLGASASRTGSIVELRGPPMLPFESAGVAEGERSCNPGGGFGWVPEDVRWSAMISWGSVKVQWASGEEPSWCSIWDIEQTEAVAVPAETAAAGSAAAGGGSSSATAMEVDTDAGAAAAVAAADSAPAAPAGGIIVAPASVAAPADVGNSGAGGHIIDEDDVCLAILMASGQCIRAAEIKRIIAGIEELIVHPTGSVFAKPVDDTIAPGYSEAVAVPVCYEDIKARLEASWYTGTGAVRGDLERIRINCLAYNNPGAEIVKHARRAEQMGHGMLKGKQIPVAGRAKVSRLHPAR